MTGLADDDGSIVAGVGVFHFAGHVVDGGEEAGDEFVVGGVGFDGVIEAADEFGDVGLQFAEGVDAGLEAGHEERGGQAFAGDIGDDEEETAVGHGDVVIIIAADGTAGMGTAGEFEARQNGRGLGEEAPLNIGGLFEVVGQQAFGVLDFDEAGVFDADGGDVGEDGEEAESFGVEGVKDVGGIDVEDADDLRFGLQGDGHEAFDFLLDDGLGGFEKIIGGDVLNEEGGAFVHDFIADGGGDAETCPFVSTGDEFAAFEGHENAAFGADGVEGEFEGDIEEAVDGFKGREFAAGADEGVHAAIGAFEFEGRRADGFGGEVGRIEANDKCRVGAHGGTGVVFDELERTGIGLGFGSLLDLKFEDLATGDDAITGEEAMIASQIVAIDGGAVFAVEILNDPAAGAPFKLAMLAGKHGIGGHGKADDFGAAHDKWGRVKTDWPRLPVGSGQQDVGFDKFWHTAKLYCESIS